jgi:hypothetical protein
MVPDLEFDGYSDFANVIGPEADCLLGLLCWLATFGAHLAGWSAILSLFRVNPICK